ncbi:MAG: TIM44-like domain-containing protein [Alphaproteobacteria bacterium]|nr:TIM44-like domain-containing protein [Alphaproteobacteria bacterium]
MTSRAKFLICLLALGIALAPSWAEARAGKGFSGGSRGQRTYQAPPPTQSAPAAKPMERSATPEQAARPQAAPQTQPGMASPLSPGRSFFSGMMGGLIGAGIAGMLFGGGFGGGMGAGGFLGGLLQVALLGGLAWLLFSFFKRRSQQNAPQPAMAGAGNLPSLPEPIVLNREASTGVFGGASAQLALEAADFDAFEQALNSVQSAWSRRDREGLALLTTEEMGGYFAQHLGDLEGKGLENHIDSVKLEKGDLSEAWSEGTSDFATVSLRFSALDYTFDKASGKIVEGSDRERIEAVEYWTFVRENNGAWKLSAIQQA